jgi:hypothetical protein
LNKSTVLPVLVKLEFNTSDRRCAVGYDPACCKHGRPALHRMCRGTLALQSHWGGAPPPRNDRRTGQDPWTGCWLPEAEFALHRKTMQYHFVRPCSILRTFGKTSIVTVRSLEWSVVSRSAQNLDFAHESYQPRPQPFSLVADVTRPSIGDHVCTQPNGHL